MTPDEIQIPNKKEKTMKEAMINNQERGTGRTTRAFTTLATLAKANPDKKYAYIFHHHSQIVLVTNDRPTNLVVGSWELYKKGKFQDYAEVVFDHDLVEKMASLLVAL